MTVGTPRVERLHSPGSVIMVTGKPLRKSCDAVPPAIAERWISADADSRRTLIVDLALGLLRQEGLAAVTMRHVAGRLGVGTMTLYTYVEGQPGLHRAMVARGFELLRRHCCAGEPGCGHEGCWLAFGRRYIDFAVENPGLYKLMFDHPMRPDDSDLLEGSFKPLLDKVTDQFVDQGWTNLADLPLEARRGAGRFWITLHGVAMLAIAGRLSVLRDSLDELLEDLLPRVAPTI